MGLALFGLSGVSVICPFGGFAHLVLAQQERIS